jgi:hypothetical protein
MSKESKALKYLQATWDMAYPTKSWTRLNQTMRHALMTAIENGADFGETDMAEFQRRFRISRWIGETGVEDAYALAIEAGNRTAWKWVEAFCKRKPFILPGSRFKHQRNPARLCVGAEFEWMGERVFVTSFNSDGQSLVACAYQKAEWKTLCPACGNGHYKKGGVSKVFRISHEDLARARKDRRESGQVAA